MRPEHFQEKNFDSYLFVLDDGRLLHKDLVVQKLREAAVRLAEPLRMIARGLIPHNIFAAVVANEFTLHEFITTRMDINLFNALLMKMTSYDVGVAMCRWARSRCPGAYDWDREFPLMSKAEWTAARRGMPGTREAQRRYVLACALVR